MSTAPTSTRKAAAAKKHDVASGAVDPLDSALIAELLAEFRRHHPKAPTNRIEKAFEMGALAHREQKRKSGEPYITHPIAVALVLAGLGLDDTTLENLMGVWSKLGNRNFAAFYGKNAINIYQEFRKSIQSLGVDEQKSYLKTVEGAYRQLASILIAQGRISEAEQVLVMLKEEELIDQMHGEFR